jgi:uncharacterized protein YecT (DUF1311 family)
MVPLGLAGASLFVLLSGSANPPTHRTSVEVTSSSGTVAMDSAPASRTVLAAPARPVFPDPVPATELPPGISEADGIVAGSSTVAARPSATTEQTTKRSSSGSTRRAGAAASSEAAAAQLSHAESVRVAANGRPADDSNGIAGARIEGNGSGRDSTEPFEDPFKIPSAGADVPLALGRGEVPSPRCRLAAAADQQACLSAYIALGDASLNRAFDSLVGEMRRVAGTPDGAPDPPAVQRVRIEQRAWLAVRDNECPRTAPIGAGPFWAEAQSGCFNEMADARAAELRDAVKRLRRR